MSENSLVYRCLASRLPPSQNRRIVVLTGARQTGKTTLVRNLYRHLNYINLDAPENRATIEALSTLAWGRTVGNAVIDEAQKAPLVFEKVKYAFDDGAVSFTVLTGSSQIRLLRTIRESLAGRAYFFELWPLMQCELVAGTGGDQSCAPLLDRLLCSPDPIDALLSDVPAMLLEKDDLALRQAEAHIIRWGGMPALLELPDSERNQWLRNYGYTYLERDLADLARLDDLMPFHKFQKLAAMRSAMLLNYSELARDAGLGVDTARRYLEYLRLSFQTILLQPYHRNITSRVVKTPKLYWMDAGTWRQLSGFTGELNGQLFETVVVGEIVKWIRTRQVEAQVYFYRTRAGMEVDVLIETESGLLGMEIKSRPTLSPQDSRPLAVLAEKLGPRWRGGLVVYRGARIEPIGPHNLWAIPSRRLFQPDTGAC